MRAKGWFGPKQIGYGVGPRSWQGWAATAAFAAVMVAQALLFRPAWFGLPEWSRLVLLLVTVAAYGWVIGATYDGDA